MRRLIVATVIAAGCLVLSPRVNGQQAPDPHHPATESGTAATAPETLPASQPRAPNTGAPSEVAGMMGPGMMGPDMMRMMGRPGTGGPGSSLMPMADMMSGPAADHLEGRLAYMKAELKITEAQTPQWNGFADAVRANAKAMLEMRQSITATRSATHTLPERMALEEKAATSHATAVKKSKATLDALYAVLGPDQKKSADSIVLGPMAMPMGMM